MGFSISAIVAPNVTDSELKPLEAIALLLNPKRFWINRLRWKANKADLEWLTFLSNDTVLRLCAELSVKDPVFGPGGLTAFIFEHGLQGDHRHRAEELISSRLRYLAAQGFITALPRGQYRCSALAADRLESLRRSKRDRTVPWLSLFVGGVAAFAAVIQAFGGLGF